MSSQNENNEDKKLIGVLAQFDDPDALLEGGKSAHDAGYQKLDAFSPFPVHGIDDAIGIKRTILPFICLAVGMGACGGGIFLQWYTNSASSSPVFPGYDYFISGKPMWSLPANIPVIFEIIVLSSAFAAFFGMLILNKLPRFANPLHRVARFRRATNDRFFLTVDHDDPKFDLETTQSELSGWGASEVEPVYEDLTDLKLPSFVKTVGVLMAFVMLIPPVMIFRAHGMTARKPRLHVNPDMDFQIRYSAQNVGPDFRQSEREKNDFLFDDMRVAREPIPGTIALGHLDLDTGFNYGYTVDDDGHAGLSRAGTLVSVQEEAQEDGDAAEEEVIEPDWVTEFPARMTIDADTVARGKKMFEINCVACHGYSGFGDGLVSKRAKELATNGEATWTEAKNLHHPDVIVQPVGRVFDTITNGRSTMGPYGQRIKPEDRWAIVLYIKAMQETIINSEEKFVPPAVEETVVENAAADAGESAEEGSTEEPTEETTEPPVEDEGSDQEPADESSQTENEEDNSENSDK